MSDTDFNIPQEFIDSLRNALQVGAEVTLPFAAPLVWWKNGSRSYRDSPAPNVPYFGGWAISDDNLTELNMVAPPGFTKGTWVNKDGNDYVVWAVRAICIAPIATRKRWLISDTGNQRGHTQILAMLATIQQGGKVFLPYGPIVISAHGYAAVNIEKAIMTFARETAALRSEVANGLPPNFFWATIGTFGKEPIIEQWGKRQTSPGTPCQVYIPNNPQTGERVMDARHIKAMFVGSELIATMATLRQQAIPWIEDWKSGKEKNGKTVVSEQGYREDVEIPGAEPDDWEAPLYGG